MKLHWSPKSPYVRKVVVAARELGVDGQIEPVRSVVLMSSTNPAVMADNPLNKIPTLVLDDGRVLYDSLVICLYLDTLHPGPKLVPESGAERWRVLQRHALAHGLLDILILWRNERDRSDGTRSDKHIEAFATKAEASLDALETEPPETAQRPDLADITIGCVLGYLDFRFADLDWRTARPRLAAWGAAFAERPSMKATVPFD